MARDKKVSPVSRLHWEGRVEERLCTNLKVRERREEDERNKNLKTHKFPPRDNCWRPKTRLRFAGKVP